MGFFSNLFKRNKPKMIEAPKDEERKDEDTVITSAESKINPIEDEAKLGNDDKKEVIICQFEQALKEFDEWYSSAFHDEKEKYQGAIDIIDVKNGESLVIMNYKSAKTKQNEKIVLAIVRIPGENKVEKLRYIRQSIDNMIYVIYNKNLRSNSMKVYLQEKMDEIKSRIFDIEFTYEGNYLLLNKGSIVDRTVVIEKEELEGNYLIRDYRRRFNTFELPEDAYFYETTIARKVKKMDERKEEKYKKEHYISDLQSLGKIAGIMGLLDDSKLIRGSTTIEYSNALRDAVIMLRNSKYAKIIERITTRDDLQKNVQLIAECVKNLIGDTSVYYENVTEEAVEGIRYSNIEIDKDVLSAVLRLGKKVTYERTECLKKNDDRINEEISLMISEKDKKTVDEQIQRGIEQAINEDIQLSSNNQTQSSFKAGLAVSREQLETIPETTTQKNLQSEKEDDEISHN